MAGFLLRQFLSTSNTNIDKGPGVIAKIQGTVYKTGLVALVTSTLVWTSIFLYAFFYYAYMPPVSHTKPVYLQFRACPTGIKGICNFPSANITLTHRESFLMFGQPYRISVEFELPNSPANQALGMFMVCVNLKSREDFLVGKSCRSALVPYKSDLFNLIRTIIYSPFLILGYTEEKQTLNVELLSNYLDDPNYRTTKAYVQVQSRNIEIYNAKLLIHAHFTGIRYLMFNYPYLSAAFGFITNLFFLSIIGFLSWYKFYSPSQVVLHVGYDKVETDSDIVDSDDSKSEMTRLSRASEKEKLKIGSLRKSSMKEDYEVDKEDLGENVKDQDDFDNEFHKSED